MTTVRPAAVAGSFYPAEAGALRRAVARHLAHAADPAAAGGAAAGRPAPDRAARPKLLVLPHAGYVYSGDVAAAGYALLAPLRGRIRRVVLLCPTHRVGVRGLAAPTVDAFATPLGRVPVDQAALAALADLPQLLRSDRVHAQEHAIEVHLPFLQTVLGEGFALLPLAVGQADAEAVDAVLERLWGGDETLIVVSSDLSHYLPYAAAQARDRATVQRILAFAGDLAGEDACGAFALNGALRTAQRHGLQPRLLDLRNSGDSAAGSPDRVVGYAALAFCTAAGGSPGSAAAGGSAGSAGGADAGAPAGAAKGAKQGRVQGVNEGVNESSIAGIGEAAAGVGEAAAGTDPALARALLGTARAAIADALGLAVPPAPAHPRLAETGACFVTLHDARGALRGCVGHLEAEGPLGEDVRNNALAAAFGDRRFAPLTAAEWPGLRLEVSVLAPLQPLPGAATLAEAAGRLRPGEDGVVLAWRGRRATFLPQVWAQLPAPRAFLEALLQKAGLPLDFWDAGIQLWRYRVTPFEELRHERPRPH